MPKIEKRLKALEVKLGELEERKRVAAEQDIINLLACFLLASSQQ